MFLVHFWRVRTGLYRPGASQVKCAEDVGKWALPLLGKAARADPRAVPNAGLPGLLALCLNGDAPGVGVEAAVVVKTAPVRSIEKGAWHPAQLTQEAYREHQPAVVARERRLVVRHARDPEPVIECAVGKFGVLERTFCEADDIARLRANDPFRIRALL